VALTVFKTVRDLTTSGWVGSIPMHSRHAFRRLRQNHSVMKLCTVAPSGRHIAALMFVMAIYTSRLDAQRDTTARVAPTPPPPPPAALQPPVTPRRAFLYSFLLPGYSQAKLGRNKAAAAFMLVEGISIAMIRESGADLHEARRTVNDTVVVRYVDTDGTLLATPQVAPPRFNDAYVHTRAAHVEDWAALLVANHLFAGADAFVAAHLWDVPARLGLRILPQSGGTSVSASFKW
jgi:hypothetical protein